MTLSAGRPVLAIPGPTTIPDEVLTAMHRPALDIYRGDMPGITDSCLRDLKHIFRTKGQTYIYIANGHGTWEAALSNTMRRGDKILVLGSGRFAAGWGEMASVLGLDVEVLDAGWRNAVDPAAVTTRLTEDSAGEIAAVLVVQIDTASGVVNDIPAIRKAITAARHDALFMVDAIASLATMPFEMDAWGIDVAVCGSQKGLMTPPGLGLMAVNDKARAMHRQAAQSDNSLVTRYWDWTFREGEEHYQKYCGTPPEHLLFGLRAALDMLKAEGLEAAWERHRLLAGATHAAVSRWAEARAISFNITAPEHRAPSVTTILFDGHDVEPLIDYCAHKCGVTIGITIGDLSGGGIRIAHMGHVNAPHMLGVIGVVEMGLKALHIPHGSGGADAAIIYLADAVPA